MENVSEDNLSDERASDATASDARAADDRAAEDRASAEGFSDARSRSIWLRSRPALLGGVPIAPRPVRLTEPTLPPLDSLLPHLERMWSTRQLTNEGPYASQFADRLEARLGAKVVAFASGTTALMTVLRALEIQGEVIVPAITFSATAHAVHWAGARPVVADVDPNTWCLTADSVEASLSDDTSAVLAVHLFGVPCARQELALLAADRGIKLIFDAAQAFGSVYDDGLPVGGARETEVFSFHATKLVPAGEGGAVACADPKLAECLSLMLRFGERGDGVSHVVGLNGKLNEWGALLGVLGLDEVDQRIARRSALVDRYWDRLSRLPGLYRQRTVGRPNHQFMPIRVDPEEFGLGVPALHRALTAEGIDTRRHYYPPLHRQPAWSPWSVARGAATWLTATGD